MSDNDVSSNSTIWYLMEIGQSFADIEQIRASGELGCTHYDEFIGRIKEFSKIVENLQLYESAGKAQELLQHLDRHQPALGEDKTNILDANLAKSLKPDLNTLWETVNAEASARQTYVVKSSFGNPTFAKFIESPFEGFGIDRSYQEQLPERLGEELDAAKECLSIGFAFAATFFMTRAMDMLLKHYHGKVTGKDSEKSWGYLRKNLKDIVDEELVPDELFKYLEPLIEVRNEIAHVKRDGTSIRVDETSASEFLDGCGNVAMLIVRHLKDRGDITSLVESISG